jgi:ribonucleotide monophosphatase NagD (HAD superfamily)
MLAAAHGLRRERTLMVGDRLNSDILFGQQAGIDTLLVRARQQGHAFSAAIRRALADEKKKQML